MQLAQRVTGKDLEEFLISAGKIRNVKMITDKNSRRPKGIAYVEFVEVESVGNALKLNGQKLFGVPIMIQPTMAEKNRAAANAENLKKAEGPKKLYVGNLHPNINEIMLKAVFEPFGHVEQVKIQKEQDGVSKGYGFIEFKTSDLAENAMKHLNGFELAGQPIRVNYVNERSDAMETLDSEDMDIGIGMSASSRASLMAKLSEGHNAGLKVPGMQSIAAVASCLVLKHMFNPNKENGVGWSQEIRDDVIGEAAKFGSVYHIHVDATSPEGCVYMKCQSPQVAAAVVNALNGRKYAGNIIAAQLMPDSQYHGIFPMAISAMVPLMASNF
jgi:RNA-binding protein 39